MACRIFYLDGVAQVFQSLDSIHQSRASDFAKAMWFDAV